MTREVFPENVEKIFFAYSRISCILYSCVFPQILIRNLFLQFLVNDKIPHQYGTRANIKRRYAEEDQRFAKVQGELDEVRGNVANIMEMVQAMSLIREAASSKPPEASTNVVPEPAVVPRPQSP